LSRKGHDKDFVLSSDDEEQAAGKVIEKATFSLVGVPSTSKAAAVAKKTQKRKRASKEVVLSSDPEDEPLASRKKGNSKKSKKADANGNGDENITETEEMEKNIENAIDILDEDISREQTKNKKKSFNEKLPEIIATRIYDNPEPALDLTLDDEEVDDEEVDNGQNEIDPLPGLYGIDREFPKLVLKKLSLDNITVPNIEESEEEDSALFDTESITKSDEEYWEEVKSLEKRNKAGGHNLVSEVKIVLEKVPLDNLIVPNIEESEEEDSIKLLDTTENLMQSDEEEVKSLEKENEAGGQNNRLFLYHQRLSEWDAKNSRQQEGNYCILL